MKRSAQCGRSRPLDVPQPPVSLAGTLSRAARGTSRLRSLAKRSAPGASLRLRGCCLAAVGAVPGTLTPAFLMFAPPVKPKRLGGLNRARAQEIATSEPGRPVQVPHDRIPPPAVLDTFARKRRPFPMANGPQLMSACVDGQKLIERVPGSARRYQGSRVFRDLALCWCWLKRAVTSN